MMEEDSHYTPAITDFTNIGAPDNYVGTEFKINNEFILTFI